MNTLYNPKAITAKAIKERTLVPYKNSLVVNIFINGAAKRLIPTAEGIAKIKKIFKE